MSDEVYIGAVQHYNKCWRDFIRNTRWNLVLHLSLRSPCLSKVSAERLGGRILRKFQSHLFGSRSVTLNESGRLKNPDCPRGLFVLVPEVNEYAPKPLWHFHGFGLITKPSLRKRLIEHGQRWFKSATMNHHHFELGAALLPQYQQALDGTEPDPVAKIYQMEETGGDAVGYATKGIWGRAETASVIVHGRWRESFSN